MASTPSLPFICCLAVLAPLAARAQVDSIVVFNEIHYHPGGHGQASDTEFVELYNQNSVPVDLSGWRLEGAGGFVFEKGTLIEGRSFLVLAKDPAAAGLGGNGALGPLLGNLANDGETLTLRNHNGRTMDRVAYGDSRPWPVGADGSGATLSKRDPLSASGRPENWGASRGLGGTPGNSNDTADPGLPLHLSEVPAAGAAPFWVEIFNSGDSSIDLAAIEILSGAGERQSLTGNIGPGARLQVPLEFAAAEEGLRLFLLDAGRSEFLDAAILQDKPRARIDFPDGRFFHPDAVTPGAPNEVSFDGRIVINEIMYHHPPHYAVPDDPDSVFHEDQEEWIELTNRSGERVDLSGWRLRGAIRYEFEDGAMLEPGGYLVVARDAETLAGKWPDIEIVGEYRGSLRNGDESLELQDALGNPADGLHYFDDAPWPAEADGGGSSLELRHPGMDNARPEAWAASDESLRSEWHTYSYRAVAQRPVYTATVRDFHELRIGFIQAGRCLVDNVSVIEDPDGEARELIRNRTFGSLFAPVTSSNWRLLGNHGGSEAISDPESGSVLKIVAESSMNYLNNICEGSLTKEVETGKEYEVRFDAKWLGGSPQIRTEVYYNKFAKKHVLVMPEKHGTPGRQNTAYVENPGPTYEGLRHQPPVPAPSETIDVIVRAADPDGIEALTLHYSVDEGPWETAIMSRTGEGDSDGYRGTIPGQARNAVVQFYVEGSDTAGGASIYPPRGPDSGAFVRVDDVVDEERRQAMRLILRESDSTDIHDALLILSNARRAATVILNEADIVYDCGIRLRGSMFSRSNGGDAGLNIKFPADRRFRGVQPSIIVRRRNPQEILVKHMANQAVNVPASYNDLVELRGYRSGQSGLARMEMARFGENYVKGAFPDGDSEPVFKMEGIRDFQQEGPGGIKRPMPIGWIVQFDLADLGDDKEQYRHVLRMISARKQDDYTPMIDLCKAFGAPDAELRAAVEAVIDTDQWARMMAIQTLCGIADVYPIENPHNFNFYRRPTDKKIIAIPWDWDFTFNLGASDRIIDPRSSNKNLWRVLRQPGINRLYRGHLLDLIDTVFNEAYASEWFSYYAQVAGTSYANHVGYVRSRASSVKAQAGSTTPFQITTQDGADFSVEAPEVVLRGSGNVRVRTLEHVETSLILEPRWIDDETWEVTLPLAGEVNEITLQARDYQGTKGTLFNPAGSDRITVTNTGEVDAPESGTLLISEIMYHPAAPSEAERGAGFGDQDLFEFIELVNIGPRALDLTSLHFTEGIRFVFAGVTSTVLQPGDVALLVADEAAFAARYGEGLPVLGAYAGNLSNGGERLTLAGVHGRGIHSVSYDDEGPWPAEADGTGASLVLADLSGRADLADPVSWRAGGIPGGTPGRLEAVAPGLAFEDWVIEMFAADQQGDPAVSGFTADPDGDGLANGVEFALGSGPLTPNQGAPLTMERGEDGGWRLSHDRRLGAQVEVVLESSGGLRAWDRVLSDRILEEITVPSPVDEGIERRVVRLSRLPGDSEEFLRLRVTRP